MCGCVQRTDALHAGLGRKGIQGAKGLVEEKVVTHIARAEVEIACGRPDDLIGELEALIADHPYRETLWAQLINAYYVADRQSDALDAYQRLRNTLADDLGVDPGPTVRLLHERVLRQQPVDVRKAAQSSASHTVSTLREDIAAQSISGHGPSLRDQNGSRYDLVAITRIGRSADNDIVLSGNKVSRHHAAIVDTGSSFVIVDLRSANGTYVSGRRIHPSAALTEGDLVRITEHQLSFESTFR